MARVALVSGGTRGIGAAISEALKAAGHVVAANYAGNDAAAQAFAAKTGIKVYKWSVSDFEACKAGVAQVVKDLGPVEILVNNAGITRDVMLHKMTPQQWREVIATNMDGLFNMTRQVIDSMRERNFGRVISISSINGQAGQMGQTNYCATKAGVHGFTKALALEGARKGITANTIAPGYIDTDMVAAVPKEALDGIIAKIPVGRLGKASEIARAVVFLAADEAGFITGTHMAVNGAHHMGG